jgi:A/G-specific adenine glycosylase
VVPVYEAMLNRFPTVQALARAPLRNVRALTDPLGYKIRGRWLKASAVIIAEQRAGYFPRTVDALRELPGVGRYTAGAVMSFAHRLDAPILDTNVARLLRRYFGVAAAPSARPSQLWQLAAAVIPRGQGYLINQALIDLGATVCTARAPRCVTCPISRGCAWRKGS